MHKFCFRRRFLEKLLTRDLPQLFVRPNKNVLKFTQGRSVGGPSPKDIKVGDASQGNKDFAGEFSVTLINARKLTYFPVGKSGGSNTAYSAAKLLPSKLW